MRRLPRTTMNTTSEDARKTKAATARPIIAGVLTVFVGRGEDDGVVDVEGVVVTTSVGVGRPEMVPEWLGSVTNDVSVGIDE